MVGFTVILSLMNLNNALLNRKVSDESLDLTLQGEYTSSHQFNVTAIVPVSETVNFTNGSFSGSVLYVKGELHVVNSTLDINVIVERSGNITLSNCSVSSTSTISCYGQSEMRMEYVHVQGSLDEDITNIYAFDQARLFMLNVGLVCEFYDAAVLVNGTNIASRSGDAIPALRFHEYSNCTIQNSSIYRIQLGTSLLEAYGVRYEIDNCSLQYLNIFGNLSATLRDYTYLYQGVGFQNSTLYKDATCNVATFVPLDNSQIIDI